MEEIAPELAQEVVPLLYFLFTKQIFQKIEIFKSNSTISVIYSLANISMWNAHKDVAKYMQRSTRQIIETMNVPDGQKYVNFAKRKSPLKESTYISR